MDRLIGMMIELDEWMARHRTRKVEKAIAHHEHLIYKHKMKVRRLHDKCPTAYITEIGKEK